MTDEILTIRDVADFLKVTQKTVYGLAQKRRIPAFKVGGQWRFRRVDLDTWIAAQTADPHRASVGEPASEPQPDDGQGPRGEAAPASE